MGRGEEQLLEAARLQDVALVQKLLHRGKAKLLGSAKKVNVNYQDAEGFSALHQVALLGNSDLTFLLIDSNASVNIRDKKGLCPLHYATWKGKVEVVAALLESGASCNASARNGCTPLHLAAQYGHCKTCKILLQYGADVLARQSDGCSALDLACEFGRDEVVQFLLRQNEAIFFPDQLQKQNSDIGSAPITSPLHLAARNGHTSIVRLLLQGGADINWRSESGTCLHEAVANQKPEIAQLLIDCGIDLTLRNGRGQTALELANQLPRSPASAELLRKLTEAQPKFLKVFAMNDFQNILDRDSLPFTKGTLITVLEQNSNGNWKGRIEGSSGEPPLIGYFPSSYVQVCGPRSHLGHKTSSVDSGIHHHDEDPPPQQPLHKARSSVSSKSPPHRYVNLDRRSKQSFQKVSRALPNVVNPSYEDVICSHQQQPPSGGVHCTPDPQLAPPLDSSQRSSVKAVGGGRPSMSNPGYEDVLMDNTAPPSSQTSSHNYDARESYKPKNSQQQQKMERNEQMSLSVGRWLASFGMQQYASNFAQHGYDLRTVARMSPSDLAAIRIGHPAHREKISSMVAQLRRDPSLCSMPSNQNPISLEAWLDSMGLGMYSITFARAGITSMERLAGTSWEDLQEMGIEKLGHQKKLLLAVSDLQRTMKRFPQPHDVPKKPLPMTPPKPNAVAKKKPIGSNPRPLVSSFHDSGGVSAELQKALNKRQRVIDDAARNDSPGSPAESSPSTQLRETSSLQKRERHMSASRGPPPDPPRRISSVCAESSPVPASAGSEKPGASGDSREERSSASFSDNHRFPKAPANRELPTYVAETPRSTPHQWGGKPSVPAKPRPGMNKKSGLVQPAGSFPPNSVAFIPSRNHTEKRFDLSALDNVGAEQSVSTLSAPQRFQDSTPSGLAPSEDFDWPAPPPFDDEAPTQVSPPSNSSVLQNGTPTRGVDRCAGASLHKRDAFPVDSSSRKCFSQVYKNSETKSSAAPVPFLPPANRHPVETHDALPSPPLGMLERPLPTLPGAQEYPLPPPPVDVARVHPKSSGHVGANLPPVPPKKTLKARAPPPGADASAPPPPLRHSPPAPDDFKNPAEAQRVLDDITSMFDGLAMEFDEILS